MGQESQEQARMELERQKGADKDEVPKKAFVLEIELGPTLL